MKFEFNPDGSLKLPEHLKQISDENENLMKSQRCVLIERIIVSTYPPKKCVLHITLSDAVIDNRFIENIYNSVKLEVPTKLIKLTPKEFDIEIGTCFRRCSDCNSFIIHLRNSFEGRIIDKKGNCGY